jgi:peptidyl-prolyl cis-trans isomerase B (cyclophilin B)
MLRRALPALAAVLLIPLAACGSGSNDTAIDSPDSGTPSPTGTSCSYPTDPHGAAKKVDPPPATPTVSGTVNATMDTSIGKIGLTLDAAKAPCTVNSFVSLAKQGYFDQTSCHRLTEAATTGIAVLQCGDPTGTGGGGPGYTFADELSGHDHYGKGVLAMANAGPDTNGSQFFLVYADSSALDQQPNYTVFGTISPAGIAAITKAAKAGTDNSTATGDGHPNVPVRITGVTVG